MSPLAHGLPPYYLPIVAVAVAGVIFRFRWVDRVVTGVLNRTRALRPISVIMLSLALSVVAGLYLLETAFFQHRELFPKIHDEHVYLIQARMLAQGTLWQPQHPLADFFENFYLLAKPKYAPMYYPGTALFFAPIVKLHTPLWLVPIILSALCVGLTCYITSQLINPSAGLLAGVALLCSWGLREFSTINMAPAPTMFLGLAIFAVWLAWHRRPRAGLALLLGLLIGWAILTRPVDAVAFALPVAVAMLAQFRKQSGRLVLFTTIAIVIGLAPFAILQLSFNHGVTGHYLSSPYTTYLKQDVPGSVYGYHAISPDIRPASTLAQKQQYFSQYRLQELKDHTLRHLPADLAFRSWWTFYVGIPAGILAIIIPFALLSLKDPRRIVFVLPLPLFILLYLPNAFFLMHYAIPFSPIIAFLIALAVYTLSQKSKTDPQRHSSFAFFFLITVAACIASLPELRPDIRDGTIPPTPLLTLLHNDLEKSVTTPAVVLFRYSTKDNPIEEPVYNDDVVYPDQAPIIHAHDLGSRNTEIATYYPTRHFYLIDRQENAGSDHLILHPLGTGDEYKSRMTKPD